MLITISQKSDKPLYQQVVDQVKAQILNGGLASGEGLPSIRNLAQELTTSVITIKRAYEELEKEGYIYSRQGLGSFVSELNRDEIKEATLKEVEETLRDGIQHAMQLGLCLEDIVQMVKTIYQDRRRGYHE